MIADVNADVGPLPLPLEGIRVLDATHIVAGPFCSLILADMGAEVIKIERPRTGDVARGRHPMISDAEGNCISSRFLGVNRNKKSVSIDLRNPRCKLAFEELVRASDVLVDNWGSGAFRRLGLGYDHLSEINPGLVYASITGYGDSPGLSGPYSNWPANNLAIQAMAGWMELTGEPDGPPQSVGDNIGDSVPGLWTALGIVLALETRRRTGRGQYVDMAMYECMVSHIESNMNHYQSIGSGPGRSRERLATAGMTFRAKDGYVVLAGARSAERMRTLWALLGRADLAEDERFLGQGYGRRVLPQRDDTSHRGMVRSPDQAGNRLNPRGHRFLHGYGPDYRGTGQLPSPGGPPHVRRDGRHPWRHFQVASYPGPAHRLPGVAG